MKERTFMKAQNLKYWIGLMGAAGFALISSNSFAFMSCLGGICGAKQTVAHAPNTHPTATITAARQQGMAEDHTIIAHRARLP
jgi:hypothetical protein